MPEGTATETVDLWEPREWSLDAILPDGRPETLNREIAAIEDKVAEFERLRDKPPGTSVELFGAVREVDAIYRGLTRIHGYAMLWFSSDTQDAEALACQNRVRQALTKLQNRILFFSLWWLELEDEEAQALLGPLPEALPESDDHFFLADQRRMRPYRLSEEVERVINLKDSDGITGQLTTYSLLTNAFEFEDPSNPEGPELTRDQLSAFFYSPDAALRETAYRELYGHYERSAAILSQIYIHRVQDWHNEHVTLRGYSSPIAVRNVSNGVSDEAIDVLLDVGRESVDVFHRFFRMKARWLGLERLRRYDIYAPTEDSGRTLGYQQAVQTVLETFEEFDPRMAAMARRVFDEGHIDSPPRRGKRGGAFCATLLPEQTPWVLVNYSDRLRDVATLAHELGHAIHSMCADRHTILTQQPSLPMAETASVFAEILIVKRLLRDNAADARVCREILMSSLGDMFATVCRQVYFVLFERAAHDAILAGASAQELEELYLDNLREQFGDSVEIGDEFRHEWLSIPHIYSTPFYCYAYAFGQLLVLALYKRYEEIGEPFKEEYLDLLALGGSAPPEEALRGAGIDVRDRSFWQGGVDVIRGYVDDLEATAASS